MSISLLCLFQTGITAVVVSFLSETISKDEISNARELHLNLLRKEKTDEHSLYVVR